MKEDLLKKARSLSDKAKRLAKPYLSRHLYNSKIESLEQAMQKINPENWESPFAVSKDFSTNVLEKKIHYFEKFIKSTTKFTKFREEAKDYGLTISEYSDYKESLNYSNKFSEEYGSPIVGELYKMVKSGDIKNDDVRIALFKTKNKKYNSRSDLLQDIADNFAEEVSKRILSL